MLTTSGRLGLFAWNYVCDSGFIVIKTWSIISFPSILGKVGLKKLLEEIYKNLAILKKNL